jgi:hypothetical protein
MAVDMFEYKFILKLREALRGQPEFKRDSGYDREVWNLHLPARRPIFTALSLIRHSSGYRLFTFNEFLKACQKAYTDQAQNGRFNKWFESPLKERLRQRLWAFYESGMNETYVYACLVQAIEDVLGEGLVFYDCRQDVKQKYDALVVIRDSKIVVSVESRHSRNRAETEARRGVIEQETKQNTPNSSHLDNRERELWTRLTIKETADDCQTVNGLNLCSIRSVNNLLKDIYDLSGVTRHFQFPSEEGGRRKLYGNMRLRRSEFIEAMSKYITVVHR